MNNCINLLRFKGLLALLVHSLNILRFKGFLALMDHSINILRYILMTQD